MAKKDKKNPCQKEFTIEQQIENLLRSDEFWDYFEKHSDVDYSLEAILKRNGITDEKTIAEMKEKSERRRKKYKKK